MKYINEYKDWVAGDYNLTNNTGINIEEIEDLLIPLKDRGFDIEVNVNNNIIYPIISKRDNFKLVDIIEDLNFVINYMKSQYNMDIYQCNIEWKRYYKIGINKKDFENIKSVPKNKEMSSIIICFK